ncbi:MFS transporter [Bacillus infantis]|jgi:MFS family permease|uniref:MFS transporter n=1 Tax=Bacillus infantis TaxID=324767 RepID=UPI002154FBA4|nr:MFS transporter [Bacillus infantis]MCR6610262.1 MFS transporter [Bacillus infantis]
MKNGIFSPLKDKAFRSLFGAQIFSDLGNWLDLVALQVIVVYYWGLGESAIAAVIITLGVPWVLIGPFASVFVDRLPKKALMMVCMFCKILFVAGLFWSPNLYVLLLFVFLKGTAAALYDPARQSMIRAIVAEDKLPEAVTLSQLSVNTMKIAGPALGGLLMALFGTKSPFIFEAAGFLVSILFLASLPAFKGVPAEEEAAEKTGNEKGAGYWKDFASGIKHIANTRLLKISILLSSVAFFIIFLYDGLFIFVAKNLGFTQESFTFLISAVGLGSVAGSLALGKWTFWKKGPIHLMSASACFSGLFIILVGLGSFGILNFPQIVWLAGAFLLGFFGAGEAVPYGYVLQSETPQNMMGRVSAAAMGLQTFSMLIAPAAGALLAKLWGVSYVMAGAGSATCLMGAIVLLYVLRKLKTPAPEKAISQSL